MTFKNVIKNIWINKIYFYLLILIISIFIILTVVLQSTIIPSIKSIAFENKFNESEQLSDNELYLGSQQINQVLFVEKRNINNNIENIKEFDNYVSVILKINILITIILSILFFLLIYLLSLKNLKEQKLIIKDHLTDLYNRRYFYNVVDKFLVLAKRKNSELSLCLIDIDNFKLINDTYGHDVGDKVLRFFAKEIKGLIRKSDIIVRFGGEEFLLLLPDTSLNNAKILSDKICRHFEFSKNQIHFTISIGISSYNNNENIDKLVSNADKALYMAKSKGKNRAVIYTS